MDKKKLKEEIEQIETKIMLVYGKTWSPWSTEKLEQDIIYSSPVLFLLVFLTGMARKYGYLVIEESLFLWLFLGEVILSYLLTKSLLGARYAIWRRRVSILKSELSRLEGK